VRLTCLSVLLFTVFAMVAFPEDDGSEVTLNLDLPSPSFSRLLAQASPKTDFDIHLLLGYTKAGVILDTVGLNAAKAGAWAIQIDPQGHVLLQVYDPDNLSPWRDASGWHTVRSREMIEPGAAGVVTVSARGLRLTLSVQSGEAQVLKLRVPLSGEPLWVGDFPGDDHWGEGLNIHPAMTGRLMVRLGRVTVEGPAPVTPTPAPTERSAPPRAQDRKPADNVLDETGTVSAADLGRIRQMLSTLRDKRQVQAAVLVAAAKMDALGNRPAELRQELFDAGVLPRESAVFAFTSDLKVRYSCDAALGDWLKSTAPSTWKGIPAELPLAEQIVQFIAALAGVDAQETSESAPTPVQAPVPGTTTPQPKPTTSSPPSQAARDELDAVAAKVEAALKASSIDALLAVIHPSRREALGLALAASVSDLPKLGEWLALRKLASVDQSRAEYEVAVEGTSLSVQFARAEGKWWLLSL